MTNFTLHYNVHSCSTWGYILIHIYTHPFIYVCMHVYIMLQLICQDNFIFLRKLHVLFSSHFSRVEKILL